MTKKFSPFWFAIKAFGLVIIILGVLIKFGNDPWVAELRKQSKIFLGTQAKINGDRQLGLSHIRHKNYLQSLKEKYSQTPPLPTMVDIPSGNFTLGCLSNNCPDHVLTGETINIEAFQMAATETTVEQWDTCVAMGGCDHLPDNYGWGRGDLPVLNVSYHDVQQYIHWLNSVTSGGYRLPNGAEWEYAARAGTKTTYPWGETKPDCSMARLGSPSWTAPEEHECKEIATHPVASYQANAWGLYDVIGNSAEWTEDCAQMIGSIRATYLPKVAIERLDGLFREDCSIRINRGGNLMTGLNTVNVWHARGYTAPTRFNRVGFRLARSIN